MEGSALVQLKSLVDRDSNKFQYDDSMLNRFLKARQYDVNKAYIMIKNYFKWREDFKVDSITMDEIRMELLKNQFIRVGKTKEGVPSFLLFSASQGTKTNIDALEKLLVFIMESEIRRLPANVENFGLIIDLSGFSVRNMERDAEKRILTIFQNYYPERLFRAYIVNAPKIFMVGWKLAQKLLAKETVDKIRFLKKQDELFNYFDSDQLPACYGGCSKFTAQKWYSELEDSNQRKNSKNKIICNNNEKANEFENMISASHC